MDVQQPIGPIKMRATTHFYDSNLVPKQLRRGQLFYVNDATQARDFAHVAEQYSGDEEPAEPPASKPVSTVVDVDRKAKVTPLNKMSPPAGNKAAS